MRDAADYKKIVNLPIAHTACIRYAKGIDSTCTIHVEASMSNITVDVKREEPQTVAVQHGTAHFERAAWEKHTLAERRRLMRVLVLMWLVASAPQGAHYLA